MISLILTTLGTRKDELYRLLDSLKQQTDQDFEVILVSQDNHDDVAELLSSFSFPHTHVKMMERGLSRGRNEGLKYVKGDVVTFSDDDCWYPPKALATVHETLAKNNCDIACFQIYDPEQNVYYKDYPENKDEVTGRQIFRKSSIEIFISLKSIPLSDLAFDNDFGLGAKYPSGEENIFLKGLVDKGAKMYYFPEVVVYHLKPLAATRLTPAQLISKGPLFKKMYSTPLSVILVTLFFAKKIKHIKNPASLYFKTVKEIFAYKKGEKSHLFLLD